MMKGRKLIVSLITVIANENINFKELRCRCRLYEFQYRASCLNYTKLNRIYSPKVNFKDTEFLEST